MKMFITKIIIFFAPIIFLQVFTNLFFSTDKGDLLRLGYIIDISNYRHIFEEEFQRNIYFKKISEINLNSQNRFTVLTIGDSFSEQEGFGYKNYLAEYDRINILHFDKFLNNNPIQSVYDVLNGDLLNNVKVDYIILQSVERDFVNRVDKIDRKKILTKESLIKEIEKQEWQWGKLFKGIFKFRIYKILQNSILYFFSDNAYSSQTYRVKTKQNLFSNKNKELLFYFGDLNILEINNNLESVFKLNQELNNLSKELKKKGIKLIVLPSPDKFDFYYDYIIENSKYTKPLFFDHLEKMSKDYIYVDSKKILRSEMKNKKDIYFYGDTHWSPLASKLIANKLAEIINSK